MFNGPQTRQLLHNTSFVFLMNPIEARAWIAFTSAAKDFLGNKKADNYKELVAELLLSFQDLKCNMSIKVYYHKVIWIPFQKV